MRQSEEFNGKMFGSHFSQIEFCEVARPRLTPGVARSSSQNSTSLNSDVQRNPPPPASKRMIYKDVNFNCII